MSVAIPDRMIACAGFVSEYEGDSCDEYPSATTRQGASFVGADRVSVAHVPGPGNSLGGSWLSSFVEKQHVLDGESYWVKIVP